jgi:hypothetical protein
LSGQGEKTGSPVSGAAAMSSIRIFLGTVPGEKPEAKAATEILHVLYAGGGKLLWLA